MIRRKIPLLFFVLLIVIIRKVATENYNEALERKTKYRSLLDKTGNHLCAVEASQLQQQRQVMTTRANLIRCAALCTQLPDCVMFNEHDSAICELFVNTSKGTFLTISACKAYARANCGLLALNVGDHFGPIRRSLTIEGWIDVRLFLDGSGVYLPNGDVYSSPDTVDFPDTTSLIAVEVGGAPEFPDFIASTGDGFILTNSSWKCTNVNSMDWHLKGFDDSLWTAAGCSLPYSEDPVAGIKQDACWIWNEKYQKVDKYNYCRLNVKYYRKSVLCP